MINQKKKSGTAIKSIGLVSLFLLMLLMIPGAAKAEFGDVIWYNTYNFSQGDDIDQYECYSMKQTPDGGYIFAGNVCYDNDGEPPKAMLIKVDENLDTMWVRQYGWELPFEYYGRDVVLTSDGGYVLAGFAFYTNQYGQLLSKGAFLYKVDTYGDTVWTNYYGESTVYRVHELLNTGDDGYAIFGYNGHNDTEAGFVIKADADGDEVWCRDYCSPLPDHEYFIILAADNTDDGGFILGAETKYVDPDEHDISDWGVIMKLDANGDTVWTNVCGRQETEFNDIHITSDGEYLIGGRYFGREYDRSSCHTVMKYDSEFNEVIFNYTDYLGGGRVPDTAAYCFAAREIPDGSGYISVGNKQYAHEPVPENPMVGARHYEPILMKVNNDGSSYTRVYVDDFPELNSSWGSLAIEIWDLQFADDGNYLISGFVSSQMWDNSSGYWNEDDRSKVFIAKLEAATVSVDDDTEKLPVMVSLAQNYPNPFNATTTIQFSLKQKDDIVLSIYDIMGRRVNTLYNGTLSAGTHHLTWNGTDNSGEVVSSGMYFYRIETSDITISNQMLLLK